MPTSGPTVNIGGLSANVGDGAGVLAKVWAQFLFSVPDPEQEFFLRAEKSSPENREADGRNVTQAWEAAAAGDPTSDSMIRGMPVNMVQRDDLLWDAYMKEVERYAQQEEGFVVARGGTRYPRVNAKHLELMLENVFHQVRSDDVDPAMKSSVRMYITRKLFTYNLLSLNQVFQFKPLDLTSLKKSLIGEDEDIDDLQIVVDVEPQPEPVGVNVVGVLPGRRWGTPADRLLIVGAHYDTVPSSPGLNDNGSGVAAMLEAARAISESGCRAEFSLLFVAFDLEEVGGAGSMAFVHQFLNDKVLEPAGWPNLQGAFILDTIMNYNASDGAQTVPAAWVHQMPETMERLDQNSGRGDHLALMYRRHVDRHLAEAFQYHYRRLGDARFRAESYDVDLPAERPSDEVLYSHLEMLRSDHSRFWYASRLANQTAAPTTIPAVLLTDTGPFRGIMAECYHSACDDVEALMRRMPDNLPFLKHTTQALVNTLVDLSGAQCDGRPLDKPPPPLPSVGRRGK